MDADPATAQAAACPHRIQQPLLPKHLNCTTTYSSKACPLTFIMLMSRPTTMPAAPLPSHRHWNEVCNISYSDMVGFRAPNYYNNPPIRKVRELGGAAGWLGGERWSWPQPICTQCVHRPACKSSNLTCALILVLPVSFVAPCSGPGQERLPVRLHHHRALVRSIRHTACHVGVAAV